MMEESSVWIVVVVTTIAFFALAAILLVPVYRFLVREEQVAKDWIRKPERKSTNGSNSDSEDGGVPVATEHT